MDETTLIKFSEKIKKDKVQNFYEKILSILTSALDTLIKTKGNNLNFDEDSTRIFPNGDFTNDTFIDQTGELEIIIASSNAQLISSNKIYVEQIKKAGKSKKKLNKISTEGTFQKIIFDYVDCLVPYFEENTMIFLTTDGIKIFCVEEYGFKVLIRFATYSSEDKQAILSFWNPLNKVITPVNLFLYNDSMEKKDKLTKGNYKKLVRIFKNIRKTILLNKWTTNKNLNQYFIELIVFNIPNEIMQDNNIVLTFKKAINFLKNCNVYDFISFDGNKIVTFQFAKITYLNILNFIRYLDKI